MSPELLKRVTRIELVTKGWKPFVLPLNYTRKKRWALHGEEVVVVSPMPITYIIAYLSTPPVGFAPTTDSLEENCSVS